MIFFVLRVSFSVSFDKKMRNEITEVGIKWKFDDFSVEITYDGM